jgi:hypothetical protein
LLDGYAPCTAIYMPVRTLATFATNATAADMKEPANLPAPRPLCLSLANSQILA